MRTSTPGFMGHKRTLTATRAMSALPRKQTSLSRVMMPKADSCTATKSYSIFLPRSLVSAFGGWR